MTGDVEERVLYFFSISAKEQNVLNNWGKEYLFHGFWESESDLKSSCHSRRCLLWTWGGSKFSFMDYILISRSIALENKLSHLKCTQTCKHCEAYGRMLGFLGNRDARWDWAWCATHKSLTPFSPKPPWIIPCSGTLHLDTGASWTLIPSHE